ncbi:MAG: tetratricopeptide repeat protein [Caulobacterales bacterium]
MLYDQAFDAYRAGRSGEAEQRLEALLRERPDHARAHLLKAVAHPKDETAVGLALVEQSVFLDPTDPQGWYNLAVFQAERGRLDAALQGYERAVQLDPLYRDALGNGCELLRRFDRFEEVLEWADRQLAQGQGGWAAHLNRAICLTHLRRFEEADAAFEAAHALEPERPIVQWEWFSLNLFQHRFRQAWECFEQRFACGHLNGVFAYPFEQPPWRGEPLAGKHILIHNEQGLGDQIMFASSLGEVIDQAARTTLVVSPELLPLFAASFPKVRVFASRNGRFAGDHPPPEWLGRLGKVDFQLPIGGLMHRLRNDAQSFEGARRFLRPSDDARRRWTATVGRDLPPSAGLRVGLCWASNPALFRLDSSRRAVKKSMPLDTMAPLMDVAGVQFVSVLNWTIDPMPAAFIRRLRDVSRDLRSLDDTAALVEQLDLVVTVDTAVAHLAGALGRPTWLLLHDFADCRWGLEGESSYWYPDMRLIRQPAAGDWPAVIETVGAMLRDRGRSAR